MPKILTLAGPRSHSLLSHLAFMLHDCVVCVQLLLQQGFVGFWADVALWPLAQFWPALSKDSILFILNLVLLKKSEGKRKACWPSFFKKGEGTVYIWGFSDLEREFIILYHEQLQSCGLQRRAIKRAERTWTHMRKRRLRTLAFFQEEEQEENTHMCVCVWVSISEHTYVCECTSAEEVQPWKYSYTYVCMLLPQRSAKFFL